MPRSSSLMTIILLGSVSFLPGCGVKSPTSAGNSSWVPDRHLVTFSFIEAFDQYLRLPTKGAVSSYVSFQLSGQYKDTVGYARYRFDQHGNEISYMSYVTGTNVPVTEYRDHTYNPDGTIASLSLLQIIDNSVNGGPQVSTSSGTTTYEYDSHDNVVRYAVEANQQTAHVDVLYRKTGRTLYRIDVTDTCVYDSAGLLLELHSSQDRFIFNSSGLVVENYRYYSGGTGIPWDTRTFEYDNQGNLSYYSSRRPGTGWTETNTDSYCVYQFDLTGNWIKSDVRYVEWDDVSTGIDTLTDKTTTTYRNISY
jgi:hypothetical protein